MVDEESSFELVHSSFRESGVLATLGTGEGLVGGCPEGQIEDTLLAVVVETRKKLRLSVVLLADGTGDLLLHVFKTLTFLLYFVSHGGC